MFPYSCSGTRIVQVRLSLKQQHPQIEISAAFIILVHVREGRVEGLRYILPEMCLPDVG